MHVICLIKGIVPVQIDKNMQVLFETTAHASGIIKSIESDKLVVDFSKYVKEKTKFIENFSKTIVNQSDCILDK